MTTLPQTGAQPPLTFTSISFIFLALVAFLTNLQYALASDIAIDSIPKDDHNHHRLLYAIDAPEDGEGTHEGSIDDGRHNQAFIQYESEFLGVDRGILGRRQLKPDHSDLANNAGVQDSLRPGKFLLYQVQNATIHGQKSSPGAGLPSRPFPKVDLSGTDDNTSDNDLDGLSKRQATESGVTVFLSINTCGQPKPDKTVPSPFPQLTMYVSTVTPSPGPEGRSEDQTVLPLIQGFASMNLTATSDVYVSVYTPEETDFTEQWSYEVAASIDAPYHNWNNWDPTSGKNPAWNPLLFVDSDTNSALLITQNFTTTTTPEAINQKWLNLSNPFTLFAFPDANSIEGVNHSFCGLNTAAQQLGKLPSNTSTSVITRGNGGLPKGQFHMQNLDGGSQYTVLMAMQGNSTMGGSGVVGGGGQVWKNITVSTNANDNCALVFDLPFCSQVAWSVPSNPSRNLSELVQMYDNYTQYYFQQFNKSMQQIACDTTDTARYSLATGCQNCSDAYKDWLCAVSLPRCSDFGPVDVKGLGMIDGVWFPRNLAQPFPNGTSVTNASLTTDLTAAGLNQSWLERIYSNQSRVPGLIDQQIQPGPYLELLPCEDLCFSLVRNCPAAMGFACPIQPGLSRSYAPEGKCNSPGNVFILSAGAALAPHSSMLLVMLLVGIFLGS